ncbi:probable inactive receptor kinase At4g23740 isoform X2 [Momordica charantia]|uniref:Probable inactive receptor kinase At4g23740 isoform X2 n=1 Tax=Momordica charantia TaxID=3673 RepID=A0A6J1CJY1_MOMCH|nr:probable inactive receptor kinase At4g23740 isoform X2 [Momordica charantia]XP_022141246.1 probable inactive receptor kinase At4g23740 isoform X2 [Momordica charantia]XP_022141247.1 probable inactive receptor kinase At4g23740 isoform X2 [Momordica charantia]XP_022141248.1 probable inactive receptor kinase At4g23740 isoform X2 [Momordica charantia]
MMKSSFFSVFVEFFLFSAVIWPGVLSEPVEDKQALLDFFHNIPHSPSLNWNESRSVCKDWTGVLCNTDQSRVVVLRLPGTGLRGPIPVNTLSRLSALETLSLRINRISGPLPPDFSKLESLSFLYLQYNKFSGPLPLDFSVWKNLSVVDLSNNLFNGSIPSSISKLSNLTVLSLANNSLSGEIPDLEIPSLQRLDLSNNNLTGNVPQSLQRFPSWVFSGNNLTAEHGAVPPSFPLLPPDVQPTRNRKVLSESAILGIAIGGCVIGLLILAILLTAFWLKKGKENDSSTMEPKKKESSVKKKGFDSQEQKDNLTFFQDSNLAFDLEDLLRASAEVLGKGTFGVSYKAALEDTTTVVVKRLNQVTVGKREFEQQVELIANIKHENIISLRAYYYSKDEKLMVYDYCAQGSVSAMLHNKQGEGLCVLDWEARMKIAIGAARGLAHIHAESGAKCCHGNIKASNIFLNSKGYGCVSDVGLAVLMNSVMVPATRTPGYRAPEVTDTRRASEAADVYSFGVVLLELLTGKSPIHVEGCDEVVNLVRWVNSVVREEWTAEVFDVELLRYPNIEEEMVEMLQIGLSCVAKMPEQRPKMMDIASRIEQVRLVSSGTRPSSGSKSEYSTPTRVIEIGSSSHLH